MNGCDFEQVFLTRFVLLGGLKTRALPGKQEKFGQK